MGGCWTEQDLVHGLCTETLNPPKQPVSFLPCVREHCPAKSSIFPQLSSPHFYQCCSYFVQQVAVVVCSNFKCAAVYPYRYQCPSRIYYRLNGFGSLGSRCSNIQVLLILFIGCCSRNSMWHLFQFHKINPIGVCFEICFKNRHFSASEIQQFYVDLCSHGIIL